MTIALLGYSEVQEGNYYNGIAKVVYQMTSYFRNQGDNVLHYHLFSREQYCKLNRFLIDNQVDIAIWHMSTLKLKSRLHLPCPLICMWHSDPNGGYSNYADVFCNKYHVAPFWAKFIHNVIVEKILLALRKLFNNLMFMYVVRCSDRFVLLSNGLKQNFFPSIWCSNKIVAIPNGIDVRTVQITNSGRQNVIFVGRLRREKRVDYLLKAWQLVEQKHQDWNLIIVGDGPEAESYKQMSKDLGLKFCIWGGWQSDPTPFLIDAKIIAMTSEYEGFGCVLIEASQFGVVPIVFNSYASAEEIITDEKNGKLIAPFDIEAFANGLLDLMDNPQKLLNMSINAINNAQRFEINNVMSQWNNLIKEVIKKHNK